MLCKKCGIIPADIGKQFCRMCQRDEQSSPPIPSPSSPPSRPLSPMSPGAPSGPVVRTQSNQLTGTVISYNQVEKYDSLGKRLFNAIKLKDRWSFNPEIHNIRLRTDQSEIYYVIIFGNFKGNYRLVEKQRLQVEGSFNRNNQFVAKFLRDPETGVSSAINTLPYTLALILMTFHLLLASSLAYGMFFYSNNLPVSILVALAYLVVLFTPKGAPKK